MSRIGRRGFLKATAGTAVGTGLAKLSGGSTGQPDADAVKRKAIPRRTLGSTGYQATILSLGGGSAVFTLPWTMSSTNLAPSTP